MAESERFSSVVAGKEERSRSRVEVESGGEGAAVLEVTGACSLQLSRWGIAHLVDVGRGVQSLVSPGIYSAVHEKLSIMMLNLTMAGIHFVSRSIPSTQTVCGKK